MGPPKLKIAPRSLTLRTHQSSSEWFENWDMSISQRAINTSHTDKQWHILVLNTRVIKRASNAYCKAVLCLIDNRNKMGV